MSPEITSVAEGLSCSLSKKLLIRPSFFKITSLLLTNDLFFLAILLNELIFFELEPEIIPNELLINFPNFLSVVSLIILSDKINFSKAPESRIDLINLSPSCSISVKIATASPPAAVCADLATRACRVSRCTLVCGRRTTRTSLQPLSE